MEELNVSSVNAEPVENVEPQETEQVETVQAESVEVAEPQQDQKPIQTKEENAKYAAIRREAEQKAREKARDEVVSEIYGKSHGIHTYAELQTAIAREQENQRRAELQSQGIDPDVLNKYVEENPDVKWAREQREKQAKETAAWEDFQRVKSEFDTVKNPEDIPTAVFEYQEKSGKSLYDSMIWYDRQQLRQKVAEFEKGKETAKVNEHNAATSTGSVTGNGGTGTPYYTREQVEAMPQSEVNKNWSSIMESMKRWKD